MKRPAQDFSQAGRSTQPLALPAGDDRSRFHDRLDFHALKFPAAVPATCRRRSERRHSRVEIHRLVAF